MYFQEALPSRMSPIHGRKPLPLLLLALRRWLSLPASDFSISSQSPIRLKVFLTDHVHVRSGIYHKLTFFGFYCGCGRVYPLLRRWIECSFVFCFEKKDFLDQLPRISAGASLLSCSLSWRSVLKFHCVGTSLMRNFDIYFSQRWSIFSFGAPTLLGPSPFGTPTLRVLLPSRPPPFAPQFGATLRRLVGQRRYWTKAVLA